MTVTKVRPVHPERRVLWAILALLDGLATVASPAAWVLTGTLASEEHLGSVDFLARRVPLGNKVRLETAAFQDCRAIRASRDQQESSEHLEQWAPKDPWEKRANVAPLVQLENKDHPVQRAILVCKDQWERRVNKALWETKVHLAFKAFLEIWEIRVQWEPRARMARKVTRDPRDLLDLLDPKDIQESRE